MKNSEIENVILNRLYEAFFQNEHATTIDEIQQDHTWNESEISKTVELLIHQDLIKLASIGNDYKMTPAGIIHAENEGIAPYDLIGINQNARTLILDALATAYENAGSINTHALLDTLSSTTGLDNHALAWNLFVLQELDYIELRGGSSYRITFVGLEAVKEWKERSRVGYEFDRVSKMAPQSRGMAFQKLLAEVIGNYGWNQVEGVRTAHEEIDIVVFKGREYYLIECKWETSRTEAEVIRGVYAKLSNRVGVRGIIVSMSGFTSGAVQQAKDYANNHVILFFGPEDVNSLIAEEHSFEDLINLKSQQLITSKQILFK